MKKLSETGGPTFPLAKLPQALKDLLYALEISLVDAGEIENLETNREAPVKQSDSVVDGVVMNVQMRTKKKHQDNDQALIGLEEVLSSFKEFMRDMAGKYAVLDRPPTKVADDSKSQPALSNQVSGKPEDLAKKQESMPPGGPV